MPQLNENIHVKRNPPARAFAARYLQSMETGHEGKYDIGTDEILFPGGQFFDIKSVADAHRPWWNRTLCEVNNTWIRLGVLEGDFHWHKHDDTDEFFMVVEGQLDIELEDRTVTLLPNQAFTVPRGVMHFPHAKGRVVVLMVEQAGAVPTGD